MQTLLIGPYTEGEIPDPVFVQFEQTDEDYTGYTLTVQIEVVQTGSTHTFAGAVGWGDATRGIAEVQFDAADMVIGSKITEYELQVWAWKAAPNERRTATLPIRYFVEPATGDGAPS